MAESKKIRNAFVVEPDGTVEERAFPERWAPLVAGLENLRDELKRDGRDRRDGA